MGKWKRSRDGSVESLVYWQHTSSVVCGVCGREIRLSTVPADNVQIVRRAGETDPRNEISICPHHRPVSAMRKLAAFWPCLRSEPTVQQQIATLAGKIVALASAKVPTENPIQKPEEVL